MIAEIKEFFLKERGEEIGELGAIFVLEFFIEITHVHFDHVGCLSQQNEGGVSGFYTDK